MEDSKKKNRGVNLVFVSKEQDYDKAKIEDILAQAAGLSGHPGCHSGLLFVPIDMGDPGPDLQKLGNAQIDNILVANKAGKVMTLGQLAAGGK